MQNKEIATQNQSNSNVDKLKDVSTFIRILFQF